MPYWKSLTSAPAMLAALSLTAAPTSAAEMPVPVEAPGYSEEVPFFDIEEAQTAEHHRYHRHRYRHRRGPGLGDVLAGVLIVGAIAHVAKEASRDDRRYRDRDYRRDARYDDSRGIDRAVSRCVDEVESERRVETVDRVDRTARGWRVEGTISRGDSFTCRIDESGRGIDIDFGRSSARNDDDDRDYDDDRYEEIEYERDDDRDYDRADRGDDRQLDDDRYASEWSKLDRQANQASSAYPGGPAANSGEIDGDLEIGTGYQGAGG